MKIESIEIKKMMLGKPKRIGELPDLFAHIDIAIKSESYDFASIIKLVSIVKIDKTLPFQDIQSALIDDAMLRLGALTSLTKADFEKHLSKIEVPFVGYTPS